MRKQHRSMRGKIIDMAQMRQQNANTKAIGNGKMNARGDRIDSKGNVTASREIVDDQIKRLNRQAEPISLKPAVPDTFETPKAALDRIKKEAAEKKRKLIKE
jgi:hypothetical protein